MTRNGTKPSAAPQKAMKTSKKAANRAEQEAANPQADDTISLDLQQKCLDIFRNGLSPSSDDTAMLQKVKGYLFNREFVTAFGKEEYLRVYASRWSPSRALAYLKIFSDLATHLEPSDNGGIGIAADSETCVVCLGGGAGGELIGLGAWTSAPAGDPSLESDRHLQVDLVDIADWRPVVQRLHTGLTTPPELSKYASQAKKDANTALVAESGLDVKFHQLDILSHDAENESQLASLLEKADLVTFMFTLNELYSTSVPATQSLLKRTTDTMRVGSYLLVVDSPGSYSTVSLNGAEKKYPMKWLLDHTLLSPTTDSKEDGAGWEKVADDDSRWFRLSKELRYPIVLEDMRFQMHLYKRV